MTLIIKRHSGMHTDSFFLKWENHRHIFHRNGLQEICYVDVIAALAESEEVECVIVTREFFQSCLEAAEATVRRREKT